MRALLTVLMLLFGVGRVPADTPLSELPLNVTEPDGQVQGMIVLWSGDAGWSGSMQAIADAFSKRGFGVVGISSLRYFWHEKAPQIMAADNDRLIEHYSAMWKTDTIILAGYSFGADMLPFAWPLMSEKSRQMTSLIGLLSPFPKTEFEVTLLGMIGIIRGSHDVSAAIAALPADRVICLIGEQETDMACSPSSEYVFQTIPGGHRYNGDAGLVVDRLIGAL